MKSPRKREDVVKELVHKQFERLTIEKFLSKDECPKKGYWCLCKCICGNMKTVELYKIESGHTKSCGCISKELAAALKSVDLTGRKFSKLTVVKKFGKTKGGMTTWECVCDCGGICYPTTARLNNGGSTSCGGTAHRIGQNSYRWRYDLSQEDRLNIRRGIRNPLNSEFKRLVKERDNYQCVITKTMHNLTVHHLYAWKKYPELRFDVNNGVTLTKKVHDLFHKIYGKGLNTKEQFDEFKTEFQRGNYENSFE